MTGPKSLIAAIALLAALSSQVDALCIYDGKLYAKTTLDQEFRDSKAVVQARVVSAIDRNVGDTWTLYRLRTIKIFKGHPPRYFPYFTERNSGGFDLNVGTRHDIGGEYLLFLNPLRQNVALPPAGSGAMVINYNCGQSDSWAAVGQIEQERLVQLSRLRPSR
ncbi:MAG TPA: hypothetical protein VG166_09650 [Caulobacteraceae bacterium]|jgi:hypothetical protein|nr:hypothetical protein [Caulobacteraceae bacterium]